MPGISTSPLRSGPQVLGLAVLLFFGLLSGAYGLDITFVETWGEKGSSPGEFNEPYGIAVDRKGSVYVTDARNSRVQKFTAEGEYVLEWGGTGAGGAGDGKFQKPAGIAVNDRGFVYVTDYDTDYIQKFTGSGKFILKWGKNGKVEGAFDAPSDVSVDSQGNVYVIDLYNHRVQKFDNDGNFLIAWGKQKKVHNVKSVLFPLFSNESPGDFYYPAKISVGPDQRVYVSDSYNNRVQVFTKEGEFVAQWGGMGFWRGRFRVASGIASGDDGLVYVADFYNNRVQVFDRDGRFLTSFGKLGDGEGEFHGPTGVAVNNKDVYVVDWGGHRIHRFKRSD